MGIFWATLARAGSVGVLRGRLDLQKRLAGSATSLAHNRPWDGTGSSLARLLILLSSFVLFRLPGVLGRFHIPSTRDLQKQAKFPQRSLTDSLFCLFRRFGLRVCVVDRMLYETLKSGAHFAPNMPFSNFQSWAGLTRIRLGEKHLFS